MIRKVAYLGDKEIADLMDNQFQRNPQLMQYKLRENYCVDCNKYRAREECRELSCRARNGRCIPLDNTLGLFAFDCLRYAEGVNHAKKKASQMFKHLKETICFYWNARDKLKFKLNTLGEIMI